MCVLLLGIVITINLVLGRVLEVLVELPLSYKLYS